MLIGGQKSLLATDKRGSTPILLYPSGKEMKSSQSQSPPVPSSKFRMAAMAYLRDSA
jgi:hypothetical protein